MHLSLATVRKMADTRPTPANLRRVVYLCALGLFAPARLVAEQELDDAARRNFTDRPERPNSVYTVRRAFWGSLFLVLGSVIMGYSFGRVATVVLGGPSPTAIAVLQISGASVLLWATLFVRGWDIQTLSGVTLAERVNRWLYRFLYCLGTAVIALSLAWTA